jgi:NADPH:quinone reductase-like Zn-dependent oxidoreductase
MAEKLTSLVQEHKIRPAIGKVYEWDDAKDVFQAAIQQSGLEEQ